MAADGGGAEMWPPANRMPRPDPALSAPMPAAAAAKGGMKMAGDEKRGALELELAPTPAREKVLVVHARPETPLSPLSMQALLKKGGGGGAQAEEKAGAAKGRLCVLLLSASLRWAAAGGRGDAGHAPRSWNPPMASTSKALAGGGGSNSGGRVPVEVDSLSSSGEAKGIGAAAGPLRGGHGGSGPVALIDGDGQRSSASASASCVLLAPMPSAG